LGVKQPDMAQLVRSALREKLYVQDRDFAYTRSSKQQTCLRVATCPLLANEGKWEGIVVLVKDVTGLVRMEQPFRQLAFTIGQVSDERDFGWAFRLTRFHT
ncbi:MAG: hypothetical protein WD176_06325, partial [Pirellulales bacterium]